MPAKVLLIEDNAANLELMTYLLEAFGHKVVALQTGEPALEFATREQPDLVVCDIQLPGIDGYEVARRLRAEPMVRNTPIIAVTAYAMVGDRERALASGFDGYLAKPIDPESFVGDLQRFLPANMAGRLRTSFDDDVKANEAVPPTATILAVDDNTTNLQLMESILEPAGLRVLRATSAREGMDVARRDNPDLVITDVHMQLRDGYELVRELKGDADLKHIPCIVISSSDTALDAASKAEAAGARTFLLRPIAPASLLDEIRKHLPGVHS